MRRKEQRSMLALVIVMAFVVGVFWAGPVVAGEHGNQCAAIQAIAERFDCPAVEKTGQTTCYDAEGNIIDCLATGQDGDIQAGVAWPDPRFTDNGNGTVTDNLTGLIWLKNANYNATTGSTGTANWVNALAFCNALENGQCELTDGSVAGDWRLPNVKELQSLIDFGNFNPSLPNTAGTGQWVEDDPFSGVQSNDYWSATTFASRPGFAWLVNLYNGYVNGGGKTNNRYVWPVRGGQ